MKELVVEGISITEDIQIAETMNEYFASVGSNTDSELPPANDHENISLQQRYENSFYSFPVSTAECDKIITNLKNI